MSVTPGHPQNRKQQSRPVVARGLRLALGLRFAICCGILIALTAVPVGAQTVISPSRPIPTGQAPHMQVKLISTAAGRREYVVVFSHGDEAISGLTDFAKQYHVQSGHFTAIGAASATLAAFYDLPHKQYLALPINQQAEVVSMVGDFAIVNGKPAVHTHASLVTRDGRSTGGHIWEMHVDPTLEVFVTAENTPLARRKDDRSGLNLIDPTQ